MIFFQSKKCPIVFILFLSFLFLSSCRTATRTYEKPADNRVNDNKIDTWTQNRWQIADFYIEYKKSAHVKQALKKARPFLPYIHQIFKQHNLPSELSYLPMLESSFNPNAVSKTGAKGLWQFKKRTAIDNGLTVSWRVDDRLNWRKATKAAAKYLDKLGKRFNYNWELALAGYNGGPTYISKTIQQQQTWNFWELEIRQEPRLYVPRFLAMLKVAKQEFPELYYVGISKN